MLRSQQSSLSRRIGEIEHHLGIPILERYSGGVRPTPAGRHVLRLARINLEEFDALIATARSVHNSETGRLTAGFCTSLSAGNLQASLLEFKERFPLIELVTVERSRTRLAAALRNGVLDVLIVTASPPLLDNKEMPLWSERVLVALPHDHSLAGRETVCWTDLRGETVLLSHYDPGKDLEDLLISNPVSPEDRPKDRAPRRQSRHHQKPDRHAHRNKLGTRVRHGGKFCGSCLPRAARWQWSKPF